MLFLRMVAVFLMAAIACFPDCAPPLHAAMAPNGVIVGKAIGPGGGTPLGCADTGWGGVAAAAFAPVSGIADTHVSRMFVATTTSGANVNRLYVGLHIENDDGFSSADRITLYFDANDNSDFDELDFALVVEAGPTTPPVDENCNGSPNSVRLYRFVAGIWQDQGLNPAAVTALTSWDYSNAMPDTEANLWELEMEIRPGDFATPSTITVAAGVRIGAKLYVHEPEANSTMVLAFPAGLTTDDLPLNFDPNNGGVTAGNLRGFTVQNCGFDVIFEPSNPISGTDTAGQSGKFTRFPSAIPGVLSGTQTNSFNARIRFVNPAAPDHTSAVAVPNSGTVEFRTMPWNQGFLAGILMGTRNVQFTQLNQFQSVDIQWPTTEAQYGPNRTAFAGADHTCLKVSLLGFPVNLNASTDVRQQNLFHILVDNSRRDHAAKRSAARAAGRGLPDSPAVPQRPWQPGQRRSEPPTARHLA